MREPELPRLLTTPRKRNYTLAPYFCHLNCLKEYWSPFHGSEVSRGDTYQIAALSTPCEDRLRPATAITRNSRSSRKRAPLTADRQTATGRFVEQLQMLRGIGSIGAWLLTTEIFSWRQIRNGRQLGALVGLVPAPYQSGDTSHDQGITRAGNRHVRRMMVQLAWSWLRYQPLSALSRWYRDRFSRGRRMRRIGIVALARKLLIALWRYLVTGVVPDGAIMKLLAV
jgi:transposase